MNTNKTEKVKELREFVTMRIGQQVFGISVTHVMDVLFPQVINPIPLARKEVVGSLNLRGRIVTALDIRLLLDIDEVVDLKKSTYVVIEYNNELFSLIVDEVGDVIVVPEDALIDNPDNLSKFWKEVSVGIFPVNQELVVILDINKVMETLMATP